MKRIANKVAVATLLSTMQPQSQVKIIDVDYNLILWDTNWEEAENLGKVLTVDQILHDWQNIKIANAAIRRITVQKNQLVLVIDTENDSY